MSRVFADITDITQKNPGGTSKLILSASSPKTRRSNVASRKIAREIRLSVLAHDAIALKAALNAAEELDMDILLIKAARASLMDMESNTNDENLAPGYDSNNTLISKDGSRVLSAEIDINMSRPGEKSVKSALIGCESNSDSDGFCQTDDFKKLLNPSDGEKEPSPPQPIAYSNNHAEGKHAYEEISLESDRFRTFLQPAISERITRIKLESAKIDVSCKDFCLFLKLQHSAKEKSTEALAVLVDEINNLGSSKSEMTLGTPWSLLNEQITRRTIKHKEALCEIRNDVIVPAVTSIPSMEIEIRSLFEEISFLEIECNKAMVDFQCTNNKQEYKAPDCNDDADCTEPAMNRDTRRYSGIGITIREPRRLSGIGVAMLRRPSVAIRTEGEYSSTYENACAKIEAEITLKRVFSEYSHRIPEIIDRISVLNSQRMQLMKNTLANIAVANRHQLEDELSEQNDLVRIIEIIDTDKDLSNLHALTDVKEFFPNNESSLSDISESKQKSEQQYSDPTRERSFAVDLWAGNGIDLALEHAMSSKQTICSLHQLICSFAQILQQRSDVLSKGVKVIQAQVNGEQTRIGELQWHAFQALINATRIQAASYDVCATSLRQASTELRAQKQVLKSIHRTISENRVRTVKEFNNSMTHETKCKDLRDKLDLELSHSQKMVLDSSSSYKNCPNQTQLDVLLGKLEKDERAFRQADLAYRNAQHSIQATRGTQAIMQCQYLSKLQLAEESRLHCCLKALRTLGYGVRNLVNSIEQSDLDVVSAFAAIDINKDLKQFIQSTYASESDLATSLIDFSKDLSSDGFGPAYDYALSGLTQMKLMLTLLEQWADSTECIKSVSKFRIQASNTELTSIQASMMQCQHLVFGFCQSVDDHAASHREIISSVDKQRHALKAEARKIRKKFATVHRQVTLATHNHNQAAETQRRLTEKLLVVRKQSANSGQSNITGKFNLSKFFSRDLSKTLHRTEEGVTSSKTLLDKLQQELTTSIRERESVVQSSLHNLQELENNRIAALNWCIPTLINHRQEISGQIADLAQSLIISCDSIDIKADLQVFICSNSLGIPPPVYLFDRVSESGFVVGEKSRSSTKSRGNTISYNSEDEEGISGSTFSTGDESPICHSGELFGGNLAFAPVQNGVAKVVATCIAFLSSRQTQVSTSTFRESTPADDVNTLINEFKKDPNLVLATQTVACVASVLKIYISELQPSLIPSTMVSELLSIYKNAHASQRCSKVTSWLGKLPAVHRNTFKLVLLFLSEVSRCPTTQATNMAVTNLAISWSPVLLRSAIGTTIQALSRLLHDTPTIFDDSNESS